MIIETKLLTMAQEFEVNLYLAYKLHYNKYI